MSSRLHLDRALAQVVKVNLAQRLVLLVACTLQDALGACLRLLGIGLALLFLVFGEKLFGGREHSGVLLESLNERLVLRIVELEAHVGFHLAQIAFLFQEFNCRLKSYVQFT